MSKATPVERPTGGPGSRQPVLKLPKIMPNGKRTKMHPLLWLLKAREADAEEFNKSDVARLMGVKPQSLYKWERACKADPNFPLPILRAQQLAAFFGVTPATFRPDFPWSK